MMIIVSVKAQSKRNEVIKISNTEFVVKTTASAREGQANEAVIELLAEYFQMKKSQVTLVKGLKSKVKQVSINK